MKRDVGCPSEYGGSSFTFHFLHYIIMNQEVSTILLAHTDPSSIHCIEYRVQKMGGHCEVCTQEEGVLDRVRSGAFSAVFMHRRVMTPQAMLRAMQQYGIEIPLVVLGEATVGDVLPLLREGVFDYLPEPLNVREVDTVLERVQRACSTRPCTFRTPCVVSLYGRPGEEPCMGASHCLLENTQSAVLLVEPEHLHILWANQGAATLIGYERHELCQQNLQGIWRSVDAQRIYHMIQEDAENKAGQIRDLLLLRKDGEQRWVDLSWNTIQTNGRLLLEVFLHDITDRKERQQGLEKEARRMAVISEIARVVNSSLDINEMLHMISIDTRRLLRFDRASVYVLNPSGQGLQVFALTRRGETQLGQGNIFPREGSCVGQTIQDRVPCIHVDLEQEPDFFEHQVLLREGIRSTISVPLVYKGRSIGAFNLGSRDKGAFSERDIGLLERIANQIAVAIGNAQLLRRQQKRSTQLALISDLTHSILSIDEEQAVFENVAQALRERFQYYDVVVFGIDEEEQMAVLRAHAGALRDLPSEYRQPFDIGLVGHVARSGQTVLCNDVTAEPRYVAVSQIQREQVRSELVVPISIRGKTVGVIDIESSEVGAFDEMDVIAMETLSDQMAARLRNIQLFTRTQLLKDLNERIIQGLPLPVLMLDEHLKVAFADTMYSHQMGIELDHVRGRSFQEVFPPSVLTNTELLSILKKALSTDDYMRLSNVSYPRPSGGSRVMDISIMGIDTPEGRRVLMALEDVTDTVEHAYELSTLREIVELTQSTLDLDRLLYVVLTCVTAGLALGFNRAFLLLVDEEQNALVGQQAIGPADEKEAQRIWSELAQGSLTLRDLVARYDRRSKSEDSPLSEIVRRMVFPLEDRTQLPVHSLLTRRTVVVNDALHDDSVDPSFQKLLGASAFVIVPLVVEDKGIGLIIADNLYSRRPVEDEQVHLLSVFAHQAAMAIENSRLHAQLKCNITELEATHRILKEHQHRLVQAERLSAVGEVAAQVAHEIRNPLVAIGGFARAMLRNKSEHDPDVVPLRIIVDEVSRLERILAEVLDFVHPPEPTFVETDLNELIERVIGLFESQMDPQTVSVETHLSPDVPSLQLDSDQMQQVLFNLLNNGVQAMPQGGILTVCTERKKDATGAFKSVVLSISDTGKGIPPEDIPRIFTPFLTTKATGTGLGLTIVAQIVRDHGGEISVDSQVGRGTTFKIVLPIHLDEGVRSKE